MRPFFVCLVVLSSTAFAQQSPWIDDCGLEPPGGIIYSPVPEKPWESSIPASSQPIVAREIRDGFMQKGGGVPLPRLRSGALTGKTIYLSASHGFTWTRAVSAWVTQRGNTHNVVEDLISAETVSQWLIPFLQNAGATVVPIRESDIQTDWVIVDNSQADYSETGSAALFSDSTLAGFTPLPAKINDTYNPFAGGGNRLMDAAATATASATYSPTVPADGYYSVYVSYSSFAARAPDAHYVVKHEGGETHYRVNQQRHGATWVLLGRFYFKAGKSASRAAVVVMNDSTDSRIGTSAVNVSLDAVRFGGGMGFEERAEGTATPVISGRPRFEESARYGAQFMGAPSTVYDPSGTRDDRTNDVSTRSRFAAWHHETGEDAVYLAWHTNAFNFGAALPDGGTVQDGTARGTNTYVYTNQHGATGVACCADFTGTPGSDTLGAALNAELISDIRANFSPTWTDRGVDTANFGEINPTANNEMPAVLLEVAFHDNSQDAAVLKNPRFRYVATRAIQQAMIKWFAAKDGVTAVLPPEPPQAVSSKNLGNGQIEVRWAAPAADPGGGGAPTSYFLYTSKDGLAWDDGTNTTNTTQTVSVPVGEVRYFRVASANPGGESFPSQMVGVRSSLNTAKVLVVNAYDLFDASLGRNENLSAYTLGQILRIFMERMNDGSYVRHHGNAIAAAGYDFDAATNDAVTAGLISLTGYNAVDWLSGRGGETQGGPLAAEVTALTNYSQSGGKLLLSGTRIASDFTAGTTAEKNFLTNVGGVLLGDAGSAATLVPNPSQFLSGMSNLVLDNGLQGTYPLGGPESLVPQSASAFSLATYNNSSGIAATAFRTSGTGKTVFLGFAFETIVSTNLRNNLMARILAWLDDAPIPDGGVETDAGFVDPEDAGTGGGAGGGSGGGAGGGAGGGTPQPVVISAIGNDSNPELGTAPQGCGCSAGGAGVMLLASVLALRMSRRRR